MVIQLFSPYSFFLASNHPISAHRSPDNAHEYAKTAIDCCLHCIIAGAGGAAHLAGVLAAKTTLAIDPEMAARLDDFRKAQADKINAMTLPEPE